MENSNRRVLLKRRPAGAPTAADFELADGPVPDPAEGEVLVRGIYLSLDPYMRGRMSAARSYARPVDVGAVMEGRVAGRVARSRDPGFRAGMAGSSTAQCRPTASRSSILTRRRCRARWAYWGCRGSLPMSGSATSAGRRVARPSSSPPHRALSAR